MTDIIQKTARAAYQKHAFYRWFYQSHGITEENLAQCEIPVLSRGDLFRFEEDNGKSYDCDAVNKPSDVPIITSGSTGRPFSFVADLNDTNYLIALKYLIEQDFGGRPCRFCIPTNVPESFANVNITAMLKEYRCELTYFDWEADRNLWLNSDYILDVAQSGINYFLGLDKPFAQPIRLIAVMMDEKLEQKLREKNITVTRCYGMMEFGMVGFQRGKSNEFYHHKSDFLEVLSKEANESVLPEGKGYLTITSTCEHVRFPLVRYCTKDVVDLKREGEDSWLITLWGRESSFKIPYDSELTVNCKTLFDSLRSRFDNVPVEVLVFNSYNPGRPEAQRQRRILTLIEDSEAKSLRLADENELGEFIMKAGAGVSRQSYYKYFPVVFCPPGIIKNGRNKPFRILRKGTATDCYNEVFDFVERQVGYKSADGE